MVEIGDILIPGGKCLRVLTVEKDGELLIFHTEHGKIECYSHRNVGVVTHSEIPGVEPGCVMDTEIGVVFS